MKVNKLKLMSTIGALGLTAGVLAGCGQKDNDDDYVKVVNSQGETVYISQDDYDDAGGSHGGMFILFSSWNGHNHSKLKPASGFHGKTYKSKPTVTSGKTGKTTKASTGTTKSGVNLSKSSNSGKSSGVGAKASSGRSGGFGG